MYPEAKSYICTDAHLHYFRIGSAIFYFGWVCWRVSIVGSYYWYFLTNNNWTINTIYFVYAALIGFSGKTNKTAQRIQQTLFAIIQPISWIVSILFWILLSGIFFQNVGGLEKFVDAVAHTLNLALPLIDLFLSKMRIDYFDMFYPTMMIALYAACVIYVKVTANISWPYPFLSNLNGGEIGVKWGPMIGFLVFTCVLSIAFSLLTRFLINKRDQLFRAKTSSHDIEMV